MVKKTFTEEDDELLAELGIDVEVEAKGAHSAREARIIAGFEEIESFFEKHRRTPQHGEDKDIFERIYATRLDAILASQECINVLSGLDKHGLLSNAKITAKESDAEIDDGELLAELGVDVKSDSDLTNLTHVKSTSEKKAAEEIGHRSLCPDFDKFKPLFVKIKEELKSTERQSFRFKEDASINQGEYFILGGQIAYIDQVGALTEDSFGKWDGRLRIIFDNGTESNILLRSFQKALYKDEAGRRITEPDAGPLFADVIGEDDIESGTIYVLRSNSDHPYVAEHRDVLHKIGVTGGKVEIRIANAENEATYLLAEVKVVATFKLAGINRIKLENLFHRIFGPAQLDIVINDRFGKPVKPKEWFVVPLNIIEEVVDRIRDGSITSYVYDPKQAKLVTI
ncbi:GIY-YIG nuclease family protein [Polynucleobacter paneuropaeus]|nr:GIY-YIG nuclease family protein [Polynucleobacter paneuropaeus]